MLFYLKKSKNLWRRYCEWLNVEYALWIFMLEISWWILLHNWADKLRLMVRIIKKFLKSPQHYTMQKKVLNIISTILVMLTSLVCGLNISSCKKKKKYLQDLWRRKWQLNSSIKMPPELHTLSVEQDKPPRTRSVL